jgi:large subunit ribosomal protein L16
MLQPKKIKYRKPHKGKIKRIAQRGYQVSFGSFGLKCLEPVFINSRQIEAARIAINRYMKREGKVWIRIFPDIPVTKKPAEVRMGKGKGNPEFYAYKAKPGVILFEIDGVPMATAQEALRLGGQKLPCKTRFMVRNDYEA